MDGFWFTHYTAISEELVEALRGQAGMAPTELTQALVWHARVVTSSGQEIVILRLNRVRST